MTLSKDVGDLPGLPETLIEVLRRFQPTGAGICLIDHSAFISLPVEAWHQWAWVEDASNTLGAGEGLPQVVFTVPANERVIFESILCQRVSGDNNVQNIDIVGPVGYGSGDRRKSLVSLSAATTEIYWPDDGNQPNAYRAVVLAQPLLLEPLTQIRIGPNGSGAGATVFDSALLLRRSNLIRHRVPS